MHGSLLLRCTLEDSQPAIWRTVRLPACFTLARLHKALQVLFGWKDYHLHEFGWAGQTFTALDLMDGE